MLILKKSEEKGGRGLAPAISLKIIYAYAAAKMTFDIMRVPVCTLFVAYVQRVDIAMVMVVDGDM